MYEGRNFPQFYITASSPCPYLVGQMERKVFTHLIGEDASRLNDALSQGGFRRSQNIAYRPACERCSSCVSVRVVVDEFKPSRTFRRISSLNRSLDIRQVESRATSEQYSLFRRYIDDRHGEGGMAEMTVLDYAAMVEDSFVNTHITEYRLRPRIPLAPPDPQKGELVAAALTDRLADGLSMIYSFYDSDHRWRSLGTFMILDHIERARKLGLPYVYLGYWVPGSDKMAYKARFLPQERLTPDGWRLAAS
ncbi:arginine-tRNA-protein transferase [Rhodoligotrophos appendicifer]|uniref:arginyltransferase n=1 Tax=Rhodoligotrophos appendicifer TaxID=987056 RepID=UPI001184A259|nr:arginyltransferase [Rhodoligotrophos appendicifer]